MAEIRRFQKSERVMNKMNPTGIDHIGVAVKSIESALKFWEGTLGIQCTVVEDVAEQKVKTAFLPVKDTEIELLEATGDDSPVAKFIEKKGEGIHHVAVRVPDIGQALSELKGKGVRLIDETPRRGAGGASIAFIHPSATGGILLELTER
jgi:methylmalonyl-CoA epimerase